jgi:glycosyltransferase involved in cell wall biosynthesis
LTDGSGGTAAPLRIIGLTNALPPFGYGYGAICRDLMAALAERGCDVTVLTATAGETAAFETLEGLAEVPAAWRRPVAGWRAERRNRRAVSELLAGGIDAAVVWHMRGIGKGALSMLHDAGVPVIYMLGDLWVVYERPGPPAAWRLWQRADGFPAFRRARDAVRRLVGAGPAPPVATEGLVCFASYWLRRRYAEAGFKPRHALVVPNGVVPEVSEVPRPGPRTAGQRALVAYAGRLDKTKGADIAIAAMASVPDAELVLAGAASAEVEETLRGQAARLGVTERVRFLGLVQREAVRELLQSADVFVMPGRIEEAFGLVYLEAMAAGAAVAGTALGGAAELCEDGVNSLIVPRDDALALGAAVRRLLEDESLRARLVEEGLATAARHTLPRMADTVEELCRQGARSHMLTDA